MKMTNQTCDQSGYVALMVLFTSLFPHWVAGKSYLINVDFNGTNGNTPPAGWTTTTGIEVPTDLWSFGNPDRRGSRHQKGCMYF